MTQAEKLFKHLEGSNNILIVSHRNPDGDTLGSAGALLFFLESLGHKELGLYCTDPVPSNLEFLGLNRFKVDALTLENYDLIIAVDCADLQQATLEDLVSQVKGKIAFINIDHHVTNTKYADVNIVEPNAASTSEIIYKIYKEKNVKLTPEISSCLLAGLVTDTNYFTNNATTKMSVSAAGDLLKQGVNLRTIINNTWKKHSTASLKIWGKVLSQLHFNSKYKIITAIVPSEANLFPEMLEGLANFLTVSYEANIIIVMRQVDEEVKFSLRTTQPHINVASLATKFGGGGHAKAAGFSVRGQILETENGWRIM
jgi:bifunctional oligoribonuclease and PAP phosphatase NrnA